LNRCSFLVLLVVLAAVLLPLGAADIPRPAPDLTIKMADGSGVPLSHYRGKVVVLEFLITTCPHCKVTSRLMNKLQAEYGPRGLQSLGVAINEMPRMLIPDYVTETGATFPVGFSEHNTAIDFLQHPIMLRLLVPQLVFIDRKGIIREQHGGDDKAFSDNEEKLMRAIIEKLLTGNLASRKSPVAGARQSAPK
jgi:peroxiredoxin